MDNAPWWTKQRWWLAIMLGAVTTIGYVDRLALSVAAPLVRTKFGFTNEDYGLITFAFLATYAAGQLLLGPLIDRLGSRRSLSLAVTWWSIACAGHALAGSVGGFFTARAALGLTEAVNFPAAYKAIAEWFPRAERTLASSFVTAGTGIGAIVAPPLIAGLIALFDGWHARGLSPAEGWQAAFVVPALLGAGWVLLWARLLDGPGGMPVAAARAAPAGWAELRRWFRYRETWGLALARFTGDGAFYFLAFWIPSYLADVRGFGLGQIAWAAAIPFVFADLGAIAGGWAGQRLIRSGWSLDAARKTVIWAGALLVPLALPAVYVDSPILAVLCLGLGIFGIQVKSTTVFALPTDLYPAAAVGTVWGASGAVGSLAAALAQPVIGWTIDHYSYEPVFAVVALMHIVSAACIMLFIRRIEPVA